ncbi:MAG: photosynthetic complex assembly protein PuhC [Pseudomonadota bacterium]
MNTTPDPISDQDRQNGYIDPETGNRIGKDHSKAPPFPKGALYAAAGVIAFSLVLTTFAVLMGYRMTWTPPAEAVAIRAIHFDISNAPNDIINNSTGDITIYDAETKQRLAQMPAATNRFVKSLASGLDFQRKRKGLATTPAYEVVRWDDGRLSLRDPITGKQIELAAFGRNQVMIFAKLLEEPKVKPQARLQSRPGHPTKERIAR